MPELCIRLGQIPAYIGRLADSELPIVVHARASDKRWRIERG